MADLPEDDLVVSALRQDDERMFEKMFRHYYERLCNYAVSFTGDADDAEEVVQQTMITIWEKRKKLEITASLKSYLYRSVHNGCMNRIRHAKVRNLHEAEVKAEPESFAPPVNVKSEYSELEQKVMEAINGLPEQCRMVFKLSRYEDLKYAEIAEHLDISVKTVENHMGKALKLLRVSLKDYLTTLLAFLSFLH